VVRAILASRQRSGLSHVYSDRIFAWNLTATTGDANLQCAKKCFHSSSKIQLKPQENTKYGVLDLVQPRILVVASATKIPNLLCQLQPAVCRHSPLGTTTEGILLQSCDVVTGILARFWHTSISGA
jgi:hypothetical protein